MADLKLLQKISIDTVLMIMASHQTFSVKAFDWSNQIWSVIFLYIINGRVFNRKASVQTSTICNSPLIYVHIAYLNVLFVCMIVNLLLVHSADDIVAINKPSGYSVHGKLHTVTCV